MKTMSRHLHCHLEQHYNHRDNSNTDERLEQGNQQSNNETIDSTQSNQGKSMNIQKLHSPSSLFDRYLQAPIAIYKRRKHFFANETTHEMFCVVKNEILIRFWACKPNVHKTHFPLFSLFFAVFHFEFAWFFPGR